VFDLCDDDTRAVIETARLEAEAFGHGWVGTEHVLLALAIRRDLLPEPVAQLLPTEDQVRAAITARTDAGPASPEVELLGALGIDLDGVRAAVRDTFGPEALERLGRRRVHQPWQPWRRPHRACVSLLAGGQSLVPRVKQALGHASRHASDQRRRLIDPTTLLLGMIDVEDALANRLLTELGIAPADLRDRARRTA
jgi:ATP-dependent Clp protease ATP-binding subunit ClpA